MIFEKRHKEESLLGWFITPPEVGEEMLERAGVTDQDTVYDIGCGPGGILILAAKKYGARGVGLEYDPWMLGLAKKNVEAEGLSDKIEIINCDFTYSPPDLTKATVITLYLDNKYVRHVTPELKNALERGARIVSHEIKVKGIKPKEKVKIRLNGEKHSLYFYKKEN